jgi:hypothetical protein
MPNYYATYAGMLQYLSREFRAMAVDEPQGNRFSAYAHVLDQMAFDLLFTDEQPGATTPLSSEGD